MAKDAVSDWDTDADQNTDVGSINLAEGPGGMQISSTNNAFREIMAQLATKFATVLSGTVADAAAFLANTADRLLDTDSVWGAAAEVTLTDAATITVDMSTFINAKVTLGGARTLGQPSATKVGQAGAIRIIQDGTGARTLAFHTDWKFAFGADPVVSTAAGATDILYYQVIAANFIAASLVKGVA